VIICEEAAVDVQYVCICEVEGHVGVICEEAT
jgi:hypothetical protein